MAFRHIRILAFVTWTFTPCFVTATPIASSTIAVVCGSGGTNVGQQEARTVTQTSLVECDYSLSIPNTGSVITKAQSHADFASAPQLLVAASSTVSGYRFDEALANAGATMQYFFGLDTISPAPTTITHLPVIFSANSNAAVSAGEFTNLTSSSASAYASLYEWGTGDLIQSYSVAIRGSGLDTFSGAVTLDLLIPPPGTYFNLQMGAHCQARTSLPGTGGTIVAGSTSCNADVTPSFALDQLRFDALMGQNTFRLTDHFAISLSENLADEPPRGVSAPDSLSLIFLGILVVSSRYSPWRTRLEIPPGGTARSIR